MDSAQAIRDYTESELLPLLEHRLQSEFLPQSVLFYAATQNFLQLQRDHPQYAYKEAGAACGWPKLKKWAKERAPAKMASQRAAWDDERALQAGEKEGTRCGGSSVRTLSHAAISALS